MNQIKSTKECRQTVPPKICIGLYHHHQIGEYLKICSSLNLPAESICLGCSQLLYHSCKLDYGVPGTSDSSLTEFAFEPYLEVAFVSWHLLSAALHFCFWPLLEVLLNHSKIWNPSLPVKTKFIHIGYVTLVSNWYTLSWNQTFVSHQRPTLMVF